MASILVVDDEIGIRELLSEILADEGYTVRVAASAESAREIRKSERPDLVLLDVWMPDTDGITLLKEWQASGQLTMPVVIMSGHASVDSAVEAMRIGALDFLEKPIALQKLLATVKRALTAGEMRTAQPLSLAAFGRSNVMSDLRRRLEHIAQSGMSVLLRGEVGMIPEIYGRALQKAGTPFVVAGGALGDAPQELASRAAGGILFIDDLFALSRAQLRGVAMIASRIERQNVRLVTFASADPAPLTANGSIDAATLFRLSGLIVPLPALRTHVEDIPEIASVLLAQLVESKMSTPKRFSMDASLALRNYDWPRNLLQLQQLVRSVALTSLGSEISMMEVEQVLRQFAPPPPPIDVPAFDTGLPLREARDAFERAYFERLIGEEDGSISRVAERSGMERTHLYRKLKQLGVTVPKRHDG
jgi:two-component system, NtrC family, nitrogen regulation response regulator NtrX